jgi:hypothetical protein
MDNCFKKLFGLALIGAGIAMSACQPKTPAEKIQDAAGDAAHETKQGMDRAADNVKDATN